MLTKSKEYKNIYFLRFVDICIAGPNILFTCLLPPHNCLGELLLGTTCPHSFLNSFGVMLILPFPSFSWQTRESLQHSDQVGWGVLQHPKLPVFGVLLDAPPPWSAFDHLSIAETMHSRPQPNCDELLQSLDNVL
jgi:hypothetical protein